MSDSTHPAPPATPTKGETMSAENWPKSDLLEAAWGIIANASEGNWSAQTPEWQEAATRWRNAYHEALAEYCKVKPEPRPVPPPTSRDFS